MVGAPVRRALPGGSAPCTIMRSAGVHRAVVRRRAAAGVVGPLGKLPDMSKSDWVELAVRVEKPWGYELHFALVDGKYCGKALHINEGHALSLQYHRHKEETVSVQSGRLSFEVGYDDDGLESFELLPGESVHLHPGTRHRMTALVDTVVLEASTTELDDVVRLEDRYGR